MPQVLSERKSIWINIKLDGDGFASNAEFDLRGQLEDAIIDREIGEFTGAGSGGGWMDVSLLVDNADAVEPAVDTIKALLAELHIPPEEYNLKVSNHYNHFCEDEPDFRPGDCLSFQFDDGDYGALLVLAKEEKPLARTLIGILDYKQAQAPQAAVFSAQNWLLSTQQWRLGQPYLAWVSCYGGVDYTRLANISLRDEAIPEFRYSIWWEHIPGCFLKNQQDQK